MRRRLLAAAIAVAALLLAAIPAAAKDYADIARNVVPSGQYGTVPPPPEADDQAELYDGLTPLFDQVGPGDLNTYFKSEALGGLGSDGPGTVEAVPNSNVEVVRDAFHVPHVTAAKRRDGIWAAGYLIAEDRSLLLGQARYNARVAVVDVPGVTAVGLISSLQTFRPSEALEAELATQTKVLKRQGKKGRALLADIDAYVEGINAYLTATSPSTEPWTRSDIYALNALKGQFLGQGGGDEARRSQFYGGLIDRLGRRRARSVFDDLRQPRNREAPTSVDGTFRYGRYAKRAPGSAILDHDSFEPIEITPDASAVRKAQTDPIQASNTLQINAGQSVSGRPLMVGGPQIGYFYPGFTYEIDMDAGNLRWRGVTSVPFPGYMLIGRGQDFAVTLTSASADIIDQYAERLCGGSDVKYRYKGRCRSMEIFDAGTLNGKPVSFPRTVHGPVVGYASVNGKRVAISSKRSSRGRDVLDQLFFRRLSNGNVRSPRSFFNAASKTPQTFNSFYIDSKHNAMFTSGLLPRRPQGVDMGLPTWGTGRYEWKGFIADKRHPQGIDPHDGTMTNWNNNVARGFGAADDQWGRAGSAARVDLLDRNLKRLEGSDGKWSIDEVTGAMNAAATQDVRAIDTVPLLAQLLPASTAPSPRAAEMLRRLKAWRKAGGSRLDLDLDGDIDHPGAAIMDEAWPLIADAFMRPQLGNQLDELDSLFGRFSLPPGGQYSGWHQYFDRDIRALLGKKVRVPFNKAYCGRGSIDRCRTAIWRAITVAGDNLESDQGSASPDDWRSDAERERIKFTPGLLPKTMRYTNRPSGIQQVISFNGHR